MRTAGHFLARLCAGSLILLGLSALAFMGVGRVTPALACDGIETIIAGAAKCLKPLNTFKDCDSCPEMAVLPAGEFTMGSPDDEAGRNGGEGPRHKVQIPKSFAVASHEATFADWDACVADGGCAHNPRDPGWGRGNRPVINVSWIDVTTQYLPWLSKKTGQSYRLLSEAEWEYSARSGTTGPFNTGDTITTDQANFDGTSRYGGSSKGAYRQRTLEAGSFPPNAFGLYDMHGNVWEWVGDCFVDGYANAPLDGATIGGAADCVRVMRGGSWIDSPRVLRSANRGYVPANARFIYRGFRVARGL